jgi:hypothetical protein
MQPVRLIVFAVALLAGALAGAQDHPASPRRSSCPPIPTDNPVYADALDLVDALTSAHVNVKCVTLNKMTTAFEGEEGAVYLRTDDSMLHAVFMPRPQDFSNLQVLEKREHDRYNYTFRGTPKYTFRGTSKMKAGAGGMIGSSFAGYFICYENALIIAFDKQLAQHIEKSLPGARVLKVWTAY